MFGKQSHPRAHDPTMYDLLKGGYEPTIEVPPVKQPEPAVLTSEQIKEIQEWQIKSKKLTEQKDAY